MSQTTSPESFDSTPENTAAEAILRSSGYALLIGIEAYRSFDPQGRFDLPAGRNDVLAFYRVARKLGFSADRIRVLTTPLLEPRQLMEMERLLDPTATEGDLEQRIAGVERRGATRQEILDGERWLADKLTAKQVQGAHPLGLMTYSGHGSRLGSQLDLCPSDVGPNLENAIDFSEMRRILRGEPAEHLTIVLDCCFAEKEFDRQQDPFKLTYLPAPRAGSAAPASPAEDAPLAARVFSATRRDQSGYQSRFGGRWHGAFTWAFTVALEQWKIIEEEHFKRSTVSHGELLRRTRLLLDALDFPQEPTLADEARLAELPLFHHASHASRETAASPDRKRHEIQLDGGAKAWRMYILELTNDSGATWTDFAHVFVIEKNPPKNQPNWGTNTEQWRVNTTLLEGLNTKWTSMRITASDHDADQSAGEPPPNWQTQTFCANAQITWTHINGPLNNNGTVYGDSSVKIYIRWIWNNETKKLTDVIWYYTGDQSPSDGRVDPTRSVVNYAITSLPDGTTLWSGASLQSPSAVRPSP